MEAGIQPSVGFNGGGGENTDTGTAGGQVDKGLVRDEETAAEDVLPLTGTQDPSRSEESKPALVASRGAPTGFSRPSTAPLSGTKFGTGAPAPSLWGRAAPQTLSSSSGSRWGQTDRPATAQASTTSVASSWGRPAAPSPASVSSWGRPAAPSPASVSSWGRPATGPSSTTPTWGRSAGQGAATAGTVSSWSKTPASANTGSLSATTDASQHATSRAPAVVASSVPSTGRPSSSAGADVVLEDLDASLDEEFF